MKQSIIVAACILVMSYIIYNQHQQIKAYKEMEETIEDIKTESFQFHLMVDRYEIALELLSQEDSVAAAKFDKIYTNETE